MITFSIITAARNAENHIADCLDSIRCQADGTQSAFRIEHLVVDGASTDGTLDIVRDYERRVRPPLSVHVVSEPDRGIYDAMNKGIAAATGDVVGTLNADDAYAGPDVLSRVYSTFGDEATSASYGDLHFFRDDPDGTREIVRRWRAGPYSVRSFRWGWMPPHPTFFARRSLFESHGAYRLDLGSAADYELMLRFLVRCGIAANYIPEVLVHMRIGGVSTRSLANRLRANRMDRRAWRENELRPYPWTLLLKPLRKLHQFL
jgi:glycosyltransferase involved in cell wall biosynthesis